MKKFAACLTWFLAVTALAEPSTSYIRARSIELKNSQELPEEVLRMLELFRVIGVGEIHGNDESPRFVSQLVRNISLSRQVIVGLEMMEKNQPGLNKYFKTGDEKFLRALPHFNRGYEDGRSSVAMAELIKSLRLKNIEVFAFDPNIASGGQDRDNKMAEIIHSKISKNSDKTFVIFGGNLHISTRKGNFFDPEYLPAMYQLFSLPNSVVRRNQIFSIKIRYTAGSQSWVCLTSSADCGPEPIGRASNYSEANGYKSYFLREPIETDDGYAAALFLRSVSASAPWIR